MARAVIFPDQDTYEKAAHVLTQVEIYLETLDIPSFCRNLIPPVILVSNSSKPLLSFPALKGLTISGIVPYQPFKRDIPEAPPPDDKWKEILGGISVKSLRLSLSDPLRLRIDLTTVKPYENLIPIMARLIRGGAYNPGTRILAFDENQKLLVFTSGTITISRADDLLDFWIMLRTSVDLICSAWDMRFLLEPECEHRQGIGATEIFKRLPGTNCSRCGWVSCMEFAVSLFKGESRMEQCEPLTQPEHDRRRDSLQWLMDTVWFHR